MHALVAASTPGAPIQKSHGIGGARRAELFNPRALRELAMPDILARMTNTNDEGGRDRFRQTLVRVMAVQLVSILLLWLLQATYTR